MPDIGDVARAVGIQVPTTADMLDLSETDKNLPDCVKQQIRQIIDLFKGDIKLSYSLAEILGIELSDDIKAQAENDLLLFGEAFFTKKDGQILYLPPETVEIRIDEGNSNGDMFGAQLFESFHNVGQAVDIQPIELSHEQTLRYEDIVRIMRENVERAAAIPAGFVAWEDIGVSIHNPALSQLFAGEIGRLEGWGRVSEEQIRAMAEGKDPPPSKKAVEWEERWHKKR